MNYRHQYHAGNFADVLKHTVLIALLDTLSKKDKGWCYLDTHAGRGLYDLFSVEAERTREFENGISKIFGIAKASLLPCLKRYHRFLMETGYPQFYPGSPLIASHCMRAQDSLILIEKHPEEAEALKACFSRLRNKKNTQAARPLPIHIQQEDGYQAIKALLPPKERRGLILIDPPFEQANEWQNLVKAVQAGLSRFSNGIYAIWYPIKAASERQGLSKLQSEVARFHTELKALSEEYCLGEILILELCIYPEGIAQGLNGAGMVIINPPWEVEKTFDELLKQLFTAMSIQQGGRSLVKLI